MNLSKSSVVQQKGIEVPGDQESKVEKSLEASGARKKKLYESFAITLTEEFRILQSPLGYGTVLELDTCHVGYAEVTEKRWHIRRS